MLSLRVLENLFPSIGRKIAVALVAVFILAGGTFVYFAQQTGATILQQLVREKASGLVNRGKGVWEQVIREGGTDQIKSTLQVVVQSPDIANAFIFTDGGRPLWFTRAGADSARGLLQQFRGIAANRDEASISVREGQVLYEDVLAPLEVPIPDPDASAHASVLHGYLGLKIAMDDVRAIALEHRTVNIIMTIATFGGLSIME